MYFKEITLNKLGLLKKGKIEKISHKKECKNRLLDLGFVPGTVVRTVLSDFSGKLKAYEIRNTVMALRDSDSEKIMVKV